MTVLKRFVRFRKSSVYIAFLLSYILILLVTLSSGFVYYQKINDKITAQTETVKQLFLTELRETVEDGTAYIESVSNEITFNAKIEQFAKGIPSVTVKEVMNELALNQKQGSLLFDYFLYIKESDEIITPNIRMKADRFFNVIYSFTDLNYDEFYDILQDTHFQHYLPLIQVNQYDDEVVDVLPFIQTFPVGTKQKPLGQVIIFINAGDIFKLVDQLHTAIGSDVYVFDADNQCIVASTGAQEIDTAFLTERDTGKKTDESILFKQVSAPLGWKFVISTPDSSFYQENREFLSTMGLITLVYLIIGAGLVALLAEYSYRPLREIKTLIGDSEKAKSDTVNEFDVIKTTIVAQMKNDKELNQIIKSQLPQVRRDMLDKLAKGLLPEEGDELWERFDTLGISFCSNYFAVVMIEISDECEFLQLDGGMETNLPLARLIAQNVGCELLEKDFVCYYLDSGQTNGSFLINLRSSEQKEDAEQLILEHFRELHTYCDENFALNIYVGVSEVHNGCRDIPLCMDEARKALEQHKLGADSDPAAFANLVNLDGDYYCPTEFEYQLMGFLKSGELEKAKESIKMILDINVNRKKITAGAARGLLFEIGSTLQKIADGILISQGSERVESLNMDEYLREPNLLTAKKDFIALIDRFGEQRTEIKSVSRPQKLVDSIAECIEENLCENWLDLNGLSQRYEVTPQYISSIFKKYKNENIKDYILKLKLQKAKELLSTTDLPVREIAVQLGYAGEIGIIRLFKKYEGTTPGDYRNRVRNEEDRNTGVNRQ